MNLYQLEQFAVAARLQHISKAAEVLNIAQPALSRSIHLLEREVGAPLFDRVGKRIELNEKGEILLQYAEETLLGMHTAQSRIRELTDQEHSSINLSVKALGMMIASLIGKFKETNPSIRFQIVQYDTWILRSAAADLTLFATVDPYVSDHACSLLKERILLAVPKDSPLAKEKKVPLSYIAQEPIVGLQNGSDLAANIRYRYKSAGFEPHFIMDHYTSTSIADMVSLGMGYAYVPEVTWPGVVGDQIALVEVEDASFHRYIHVEWPTNGYMSRASRVFRSFLISYFSGIS